MAGGGHLVRVITVAPDVASSTQGAGSRCGTTQRPTARRSPRPVTRGGRFPCQPRMNARSAALRDNKRGSRRLPGRQSAIRKDRRCRALVRRCRPGALTNPPRWRQLRFPDGRPGHAPCGAKGVAVVTCPSSPGLGPVQPSPERWRPRGPIRSALPAAMPALTAGRSLKRARHDRTAGRHPMPRTVPALL